MDDTITIISPDVSHAEELAALGRQTFIDAYRVTLPEQELLAYVEDAFSVGRIRQEIETSHADYLISLSSRKEICGYIKFVYSRLPLCVTAQQPVELQRLYVKDGFLGKRVGSLLLSHGEELVAAKKYSTVWLRVWEGNKRAQQMYLNRKYSFCGDEMYQVGSEERKVLVMLKKLDESL
jgi:ribosomal protein S18 acetylase RimI-like enzyme